jgi:hypothetical protein
MWQQVALGRTLIFVFDQNNSLFFEKNSLYYFQVSNKNVVLRQIISK